MIPAPDYYTRSEGGKYITWHHGPIASYELVTIPMSYDSHIRIAQTPVHSLIWIQTYPTLPFDIKAR